jgi:hypothetical protein
MNNIYKGYVTSALGLIIMVCVLLHFFGIVVFPNPSSMSKNSECIIAFLVGLALFLVPAGKLEEILEKKIKDKADTL